MIKERLHIDDQVFDHRQAQDRLKRQVVALKVLDEDFAGETVRAVDPHRVRAANPVAHERRKAKLSSWSHLIFWMTSSTRSHGSASTVNSCQRGSLSASGSYRLIRTVKERVVDSVAVMMISP